MGVLVHFLLLPTEYPRLGDNKEHRLNQFMILEAEKSTEPASAGLLVRALCCVDTGRKAEEQVWKSSNKGGALLSNQLP